MFKKTFIPFILIFSLSQLDILSPRGRKILHSCFDPTHGGKDSVGWCATCDPDAKRGQSGYCGPDQTNGEEEAAIIYPNSTNWGFCSTKCFGREEENMIKVKLLTDLYL